MLNENLKNIRKSKGLSQEELAIKLNVVRQTVSKWEKGLSVPDSEMLVEIASQLETPVSMLLGETLDPTQDTDTVQILSEKLTRINEQLARNAEKKRKAIRLLSIVGVVVVSLFIVIQFLGMIYLHLLPMMSGDSSTAIIGGADGPTAVFVSLPTLNIPGIIVAIVLLSASIVGICATKRK